MKAKMLYIMLICLAGCICPSQKKLQYNGIVVNKYMDENTTVFGNIVVINFADHDTVVVYTTNDHSSLYNDVELGDTLVKKRGASEVMLLGIKHRRRYSNPFICR